MNYFVDTHTHLFAEEFNGEKTEVIQRSIDAGVEKMFLPNIDLETISEMYALEKQFPDNCYAMMGVHPEAIKADYKTVLAEVYKEFHKRKFIAVGEIGIDLYWDKSFEKEQKAALEIQLGWAKEFDLPFSIHVRDSFPQVFEVLDKVKDEKLKGVIHCFTGGKDEVEKILNYNNVYFGIGGISTFKKSELREIIPLIPKNRILLETDSPYLAPVPKRGKRNESSFIPYIAENLATIWQVSLSEVAQITTENAQRLFKF